MRANIEQRIEIRDRNRILVILVPIIISVFCNIVLGAKSMNFFRNIRLDFIDWRIHYYGELNRADLVRIFSISENQASVDIRDFIAAHPGAIKYDLRAKRYVPAKKTYKAQRNMDDENVIEAIERFTLAGHPMGWVDQYTS